MVFYGLGILLEGTSLASDISMFVYVFGMASLWVLPVVPISYIFRAVRNHVKFQIGFRLAVSCVVITSIFIVWGTSMVLMAASSI